MKEVNLPVNTITSTKSQKHGFNCLFLLLCQSVKVQVKNCEMQIHAKLKYCFYLQCVNFIQGLYEE